MKKQNSADFDVNLYLALHCFVEFHYEFLMQSSLPLMTSPLGPGLLVWSFPLYAKRDYWLCLGATDPVGAEKPTQGASIRTLRS